MRIQSFEISNHPIALDGSDIHHEMLLNEPEVTLIQEQLPTQGLAFISRLEAEEMARRLTIIYSNDPAILSYNVTIQEERVGVGRGPLFPFGCEIRYRVIGQYSKAHAVEV